MIQAPIHLIHWLTSEEYIQSQSSEDWILDSDGNPILDTESLNISEFTGDTE